MPKRQLMNALSFRSIRGQNKVLFMEKVQNEDGTIVKNIIKEDKPGFSFYITKPEFRISKPTNFIEIDKVEKLECDYDDLFRVLFDNNRKAQEEGLSFEEFYNNNKQSLSAFHGDYNIHLSDIDLTDYKIKEYQDRYANEEGFFKLEKGFFDIEVDISNYFQFPEPEEAPCPVCLISYFHEASMTLHGFILNDPTNKSQQEFLENIDLEWFETTRLEYFSEEKSEIKELDLHIFDDELELITEFFKMVNSQKPDFMCGWNTYFDLKTMEQRLEQLYEKKNDEKSFSAATVIMSDPSLKMSQRKVYFSEDTFNQTDHSKKNDRLFVTAFPQYVDLKFAYASIRIPKGKKDSYALDDITTEELNQGKIELDGDIRTSLRKNFENFLIYSLTDSYRLYQLENKNKDVDLLHGMASLTATRFTKVLSKTTSLRNFAAKLLFKEGIVLSNNKNRMKREQKKEKFKGAYVAPPELMANNGVILNGVPSNKIFENVIDEDLSSMYPSIILSCNIDSTTMIGKITSELDYHIGEKIFTWLIEDDTSIVATNLLSLPTASEVLNDLENYLTE